MVKLMALYTRPNDPQAFDRHYREVHTPLVRRMPGLKSLAVYSVEGIGETESPYYQMAEMVFENPEALGAAMTSDAGKAAARDLRGFAAPYVHMFVAQAQEE